jgi:hypothetical protein
MSLMRSFVAGLAGALLLIAPAGLSAWGLDVHRVVTARALDGLPPEIKPFFAARREFISEHSVDPDLWRIVGLKGDRGEEDPNHFLDMDGLDEPRPFTNVPRDWEAYVKRYGAERANRNGRLPWRTEEVYRLLVARFQDIAKGQPYAADNAAYLSAVLAHYVQDAHVPFHAVTAYDGQATNQRGIHSRFETGLVLRVRDTLTWSPIRIRPVPDIKAFVFDRLAESEALVDPILAADRTAAAGRDFYDDQYFEVFAKAAKPIAQQRLNDAASSAASVIVAAWIEAGRPALPLDTAFAPARIRR